MIARKFLKKLRAKQQLRAFIEGIASKLDIIYKNRNQKAFIR